MASLRQLPHVSDHADGAVDALLAALRVCDDETCEHAYRVADLAVELTALVAPELADEPGLRHAYLLHDVGKIGVPSHILLKAEPLNEHEVRIVRSHTTFGGRIVDELQFFPSLVHDVVTSHHEHWNGGGYPLRLQRHQIPLAARIFSVVDAFDAMTHDRPYRPARSEREALKEIERCARTQFDPSVVAAFSRVLGPSKRAFARPPSAFGRLGI
jgi:putative nucleotidyltransferase with HDIG domain